MENIKLISELETICVQTAGFIRENFRQVRTDQVELKSVNSMVSFVDKEAELMITNKLKTLIPAAGFLTEENMIKNSLAEYIWIVDPLDGTTNYIKGIPHFAISIALQRAGKNIVGMVYDVMQQDVYYASDGHGAYKNAVKLQVNKPIPVQEMLVATGFPYDKTSITPGFMSALNYFVNNSRCIRRLGSAALDLCYTASGIFDLYFEMHLKKWDYAAGALIVQEAGGQVFDLKGDPELNSGHILATNPENIEVINILLETLK